MRELRGDRRKGEEEAREVTEGGRLRKKRVGKVFFFLEGAFQVRTPYSPLSLFVIFSTLSLDIIVCFRYVYQAILLAFLDL